MLSDAFTPAVSYLDSATYGLPPAAVAHEIVQRATEWAEGRYDPRDCDLAITRARAAFGRLHGVGAAEVTTGHQVSPLVALIATALPPGARVLAAEGDFTSLLFPFVAAGCDVRSVPLDGIAEVIDTQTAIVAVSAVQSADGRVADLPAIAASAGHHGALTLIDATQASGWLPLDASAFDAVIAGGYKWLCQPRGSAFMVTRPELRERMRPLCAGWFAGASPWDTCYGLPLRLAGDARRFDVSPAWLPWHAAALALELLEEVGIARIHDHNVALAARLRAGLGLAGSEACRQRESAIVAIDAGPTAAEELRRAGVRASVRAGRVRLSCHLYNSEADVDRALDVLAHSAHRHARGSRLAIRA